MGRSERTRAHLQSSGDMPHKRLLGEIETLPSAPARRRPDLAQVAPISRRTPFPPTKARLPCELGRGTGPRGPSSHRLPDED
jgi:hypothetical protein